SLLALAAFLLFVLRRRKRLMRRFADKNLLPGIGPTVSPKRKAIKMLLIFAAALLALASLARPQWGFEWEEVKRVGLDMLIAIDTSKSMLAKDMKPNRLERSKFAIKDLVKKLNGDRIGMVAFAGSAFLQCPLTIDYNGFLLTLDDLSVGTIPRGGTSMASAIREAFSVFQGPDKQYKVLVIITDGEDLEGDVLKAVDEAAKSGIKIFCVGVGTTDGELIQVSGRGGTAFLEDKQGNAVKTKLNEDLLKKIALSTGGSYIRASQSDFGLVRLYDESISKLEKRDIESKMRKKYHERYQYLLSIALILLLIEPLVSERKRAAS
ncbi:MAG TPA: VWA domain-containing protein, partial [Candidatus Omnitrophota bacterium]|nr:VWA domain-containing protein [Candidatus Omnitrophota bacterium]